MRADRRPRRTQDERSADTRTRLIEAAIDCIAELGWSATTTPVVAERAGLSRGAQQHHFSTKADLLTAVVEYLTHRVHDGIRMAVADLPDGADRLRTGLDLYWESYAGRLGVAHIELIVAARSDPRLHDVLLDIERSFMPESRELLRKIFVGDNNTANVAQLDALADMTSQFMRGLFLRGMLSSNPERMAREKEALFQIVENATASIEAGQPLLLFPTVDALEAS